MLVELNDGKVKDLHYTIAAEMIKQGKGVVFEGERILVEPKEKKVKKGRPKKEVE